MIQAASYLDGDEIAPGRVVLVDLPAIGQTVLAGGRSAA